MFLQYKTWSKMDVVWDMSINLTFVRSTLEMSQNRNIHILQEDNIASPNRSSCPTYHVVE